MKEESNNWLHSIVIYLKKDIRTIIIGVIVGSLTTVIIHALLGW